MSATLRALLIAAVSLAVCAGVVWVGLQWNASRVPGTYSLAAYGEPDWGGGHVPGRTVAHGAPGHDHGDVHASSVRSLRGPSGPADVRFSLAASRREIELASGKRVDGLAFNGTSPGPELRVREGQVVEVTLRNVDVESGITLHWHGVDVPNAEDGVPGVTQDAVPAGGRHTYRFRADQAGSFWYHSHQSADLEVQRGLFGALVVEPRDRTRAGLDLPVLAHTHGGIPTLNGADGVSRRAVAPGTDVRLRLTNTDSTRTRLLVGGTPFRVAAIDATELNAPGELRDTALDVAAGGRFDVTFAMPQSSVVLAWAGSGARLVLSPGGHATTPAVEVDETFDPSRYGRPAPTPFGARSRFDRTFEYRIGRSLGFRDGKPGWQWTVNGGIYPRVPLYMVERGDLVKTEIVNDTDAVHPMHLHGHHVLVLSRNGRPVSGSPWWADTLDVGPNERYEVAFRADNPGLWMDHCHNLGHAAEGLTIELAYAGVTSPYAAGGHAHNEPE